jgi:hypothetical protein
MRTAMLHPTAQPIIRAPRAWARPQTPSLRCLHDVHGVELEAAGVGYVVEVVEAVKEVGGFAGDHDDRPSGSKPHDLCKQDPKLTRHPPPNRSHAVNKTGYPPPWAPTGGSGDLYFGGSADDSSGVDTLCNGY